MRHGGLVSFSIKIIIFYNIKKDNDMQFSKDAYEELKGHEVHFTRAVKGGYIMGVTPQLAEKFLKWYKALGGNKHINLACSNCVYTMLKDMGEAYFKWVKNAIETKEELTEEPDITEEELEKAADEINEAIIGDMKKNAYQDKPKKAPRKKNNTKKTEK